MPGDSGTTIAQAYVQVLPSAEGIQARLEEILGKNMPDGSKAGSSWGNAFQRGLGAAGTIATGAIELSKQLVEQIDAYAAYGDNIDKMSQKMGISAEAYQEWDAILQHSGSSIDALMPSMKTLATAVETESEAFARLGLSQEQIAGMNQEELFAATIAGLQGVTDTTERTYLAGKLLGRGATELGPLLNTSAEDVEAMRQRVHELGGVMSNEAVAAAAKYQDTMQDMQTAITGLTRGILTEFLPDVTTMLGGVTELFSGDSDKGIAIIVDGIDGLAEKIIDKSPEITEAAVKLAVALATGLIKATPRIVAAIPQIILAIVRGLWDGSADLRDAGDRMLDRVRDSFINRINQAKSWGRDLIQNFINGILEKWDALKNAVSGAAQVVKNHLGFSEPEEGPLSDFHTYAPDMIDLWNQGLKDNEYKLRQQLTASFDLGGALRSAVQPAAAAASPSVGGVPSERRELTVILMLERTELGRCIYQLNNEETQRVGLKLSGGVA